jgi:hypothetical protein
MLVSFVIDADSFKPELAWTQAQLTANHRSLLDVWQRIGLLTHDNDTFEGSKLNQAIQSLPQKIRPLWQEILMRVPVRAKGDGWDGTVVAANIGQLRAAIPLALVDDAHAEVEFGFAEDDLFKSCAEAPEVELCRFSAAGQARRFQQALSQSGVHILAGDRFSDIWDLRFKTLAAAPIKRIAIVDRYAVSQHFLCPNTHLSGLERFLRLLDRDSTGARHVALFSAWTEEMSQGSRKTIQDIEAELRMVMNRLPVKNVKRLKITMLPNTAFRDDGHDRFLRFGEYVWDLGLGLEVLEGAFSAKRSSATFKTGVPVTGYKDIEQELSGRPQAISVEIA